MLNNEEKDIKKTEKNLLEKRYMKLRRFGVKYIYQEKVMKKSDKEKNVREKSSCKETEKRLREEEEKKINM